MASIWCLVFAFNKKRAGNKCDFRDIRCVLRPQHSLGQRSKVSTLLFHPKFKNNKTKLQDLVFNFQHSHCSATSPAIAPYVEFFVVCRDQVNPLDDEMNAAITAVDDSQSAVTQLSGYISSLNGVVDAQQYAALNRDLQIIQNSTAAVRDCNNKQTLFSALTAYV